MTWAPLLLTDPSPSLRLMVLREILNRPEDDAEVRELAAERARDPLVAQLIATQEADGLWERVDLRSTLDKTRTTALALARLGYLGFGPEHPVVSRGAEALFALQREDGSWPLPGDREEGEEDEGYAMIPLQTSLPLRGLAACGYASDARAERAYDWLLAQRLEDGAWPTGIAAGNYGRVAGYRKLAHSRWGCRSNTTGALICLALHPQRRHSAAARRGLDLLLGRETREQHTLGFEVARLIGLEPARGFLTTFARFDLALLLSLAARIGASRADPRVAEAVAFVQGVQGSHGLWTYAPYPQASRWVTFDLLRSLARLDEASDWVSVEPRTPFQTYPRHPRRY